MKLKLSKLKKADMDKNQTRLIMTVGIATVITIFCLVSTKALLAQASYHRSELAAKRAVIKQLKSNIDTAATLQTQYQAFNSVNPNFIGGKNVTEPNASPPDGDNARLVLNALPSKYDFPALISSVSKILSGAGMASPGIAASDMSATTDSTARVNPTPVEITLSLNGVTTYGGAQNLIRDLEGSIRPFNVTTLEFGGSSASISLSAGLSTYFQPAKALGSGSTKEVK